MAGDRARRPRCAARARASTSSSTMADERAGRRGRVPKPSGWSTSRRRRRRRSRCWGPGLVASPRGVGLAQAEGRPHRGTPRWPFISSWVESLRGPRRGTRSLWSARSGRGGLALTRGAGPLVVHHRGGPRCSRALTFSLDLEASPSFGTGGSSRVSATSPSARRRETYGPTYAMMTEAHQHHPRAWSYRRNSGRRAPSS